MMEPPIASTIQHRAPLFPLVAGKSSKLASIDTQTTVEPAKSLLDILSRPFRSAKSVAAKRSEESKLV